jgi:elongation factor P
MATTSDFKNGLVIEYNSELYQIVDFQHVKPGKGGAFVRTKLKSLKNGRVIENTFNAGVKITTARIEKRPFQYLYHDESGYIFMNQETFEQVTLQKEMIPEYDLMKDGLEIEITFHEETETPLYVELPSFIELEVTYTEPGLRGDTATNTLKSATLETGAEIQVPLFIDIGDMIRVDTRIRGYYERVKK